MSKGNNKKSNPPAKGCTKNGSIIVNFRLPSEELLRVRKVAIKGGATNVGTRVVSPNQEAGFAIFKKRKEAAEFKAWLRGENRMELVEEGDGDSMV